MNPGQPYRVAVAEAVSCLLDVMEKRVVETFLRNFVVSVDFEKAILTTYSTLVSAAETDTGDLLMAHI